MSRSPRAAAFTALEAVIVLGVVLVVGFSIAAVVLRERPHAGPVRVVSADDDVSGCAFVGEISVPIGNPNGNRFEQGQSLAADAANAERTLRSRAASAGADTVIVTSPGLLVRAKAYRCSPSR